ncbi:uncharacterized protein LY89DRAFT_734986 [Mollisia scopiformis]|uniref:Uncharacterized protein n=1 Tax=Mollisia scopiformis TaxID=149040 RepID=A0A194X6N4_MOLSC|nr:uncharacterized protein LY89DRAFT_734986 [Mollisia scopiformis]KUJ15840.1 hypothetical protein LY89DRAFT_734986 [Mollisia scopiformis]
MSANLSSSAPTTAAIPKLNATITKSSSSRISSNDSNSNIASATELTFSSSQTSPISSKNVTSATELTPGSSYIDSSTSTTFGESNSITELASSSSQINSYSSNSSTSFIPTTATDASFIQTGMTTSSNSFSVAWTTPTSFSTVTVSRNSSSTGPISSLLSSSIWIPGTGMLPFPTTTGSSLSQAPLTFSGTWTDLSTTAASFVWFDIPTATIADTTATSEAALLGNLFFALQANRHLLTDPKLKSQFLDDVEKTKDEALALFNDLDVKIPSQIVQTQERERGMRYQRSN